MFSWLFGSRSSKIRADNVKIASSMPSNINDNFADCDHTTNPANTDIELRKMGANVDANGVVWIDGTIPMMLCLNTSSVLYEPKPLSDMAISTPIAIRQALLFCHLDCVPSPLALYYECRAKRGDIITDSGVSLHDAVNVLCNVGTTPDVYWPYDFKKFAVSPLTADVNNPRYRWSVDNIDIWDAKTIIARDYLPVLIYVPLFGDEMGDIAVTSAVLTSQPKGYTTIVCVGYDNTRNVFMYIDNVNEKISYISYDYIIKFAKYAYKVRKNCVEKIEEPVMKPIETVAESPIENAADVSGMSGVVGVAEKAVSVADVPDVGVSSTRKRDKNAKRRQHRK